MHSLLLNQKVNEDYWMSKLGDIPETQLWNQKATDDQFTIEQFSVILPEALLARLHEVDKGKVVNRYLFHITAFYLLLRQQTNTAYQVVRTFPITRDYDKTSSLSPGFFALEATHATSVRQFLKVVHEQLIETRMRNNYDFNAFLDRYRINHADQFHHLFRSSIAYNLLTDQEHCNADNVMLSLSILENDETLAVTWHFDSRFFPAEEIEHIHDHYQTILSGLLTDFDRRLLSVSGLSEKGRKLLDRFNRASQQNLDSERTFLDLFKRQVTRTPERIALNFQAEEITYRQLNQLSDQVAIQIEAIQITDEEEAIVGIMTESNIWRIVGILGILKTGAAYLPIKATFPPIRINYMLKDCGCKSLLVDESTLSLAAELEVEHYVTLSPQNISETAESYEKDIQPDNLFVVLYTSGTKGTPKGVLIEHRNIVDRLLGEVELYNLDESIVTIQTSNYAFDSSLLDIFLPLVLGGRMVLPDENEVLDFDALARLIENKSVTDIQANPHFLKRFINTCIVNKEYLNNSLKRIWSGGESLDKATVEKLNQHFDHIRLSNHYGPTEGTIDAVVDLDVKDFQRDIIGRPMINMQVYILNEFHQQVPVGVPGEICIAGKGLARGYLNQSELTDKKFIPNPVDAGGRLYKTGDLGRWLGDGKIEYLGRIDDQVKIRGYRVEPMEIEKILLNSPGIQDVMVLINRDRVQEKSLIAFYIIDPLGRAGEKSIEEYCRQNMPDYMVPSFFIKVDEFPFGNGKVDKNKLLKQGLSYLDQENTIELPQNDIEFELLGIWKALLCRSVISTESHFFEIGGNSLIAAELVFEIYKKLEVKLELRDIFAKPTIRALAELIASQDRVSYESIPKVVFGEYYRASKAQERIWIACQFSSNATAYNISDAFVFKGQIDIDSFKAAFYYIVQRHESLRTTFHMIEDVLYQKVHEYREGVTSFIYLDLKYDEHREKVLSRILKEAIDHETDFETGPVIWAKLIRMGASDYRFLISMHHIVSDEWSLVLYIDEFLQAYEAIQSSTTIPLSPLTIQYKDYAAWSWNSSSNRDDISFWRQHLKDIEPLQLPLDYARSAKLGRERYREEDVSKYLKEIKRLSSQMDATVFITMLTIFDVLLYEICHQKDILIGTIGLGRDHPDLTQVIGVFVNTIILRTFPDPEKSFRDFYSEVKSSTLDSFQHQRCGFETIMDELNLQPATHRSVWLNVFFEYQNLIQVGVQEVEITSLTTDIGPVAKYDLSVSVSEKEDGLSLRWTYNDRIFASETIKKMSRRFVEILCTVLQNPDMLIGELTTKKQSAENIFSPEITFNFLE